MTSNGVKKRILEYLERKGININQFEKSIGASKSYFRNVKNISVEVLSEICRVYPDIDTNWLLRGEGDMLKVESTNNVVASGESSVAAMNSHVNTGGGQLVESLKREIELKDRMLEDKERLINVLMEGRK